MSRKLPPDSPIFLLLNQLTESDRQAVDAFLDETLTDDPDLAGVGLIALMISIQLEYTASSNEAILQNYREFRAAQSAQLKEMEQIAKDVRIAKAAVSEMANHRLYPPVPHKITSPRLMTILGICAFFVLIISGYHYYSLGTQIDVHNAVCVSIRSFEQGLYNQARRAGNVPVIKFLSTQWSPAGCRPL